MTTLEELFDISVTSTTESLTLPGFGKMLCLVSETPAGFTDRVREYGSRTEMVTDGFGVNDVACKMMDAIKAQNPTVGTVLFGRRANKRAQSVTFTVTSAAEGTVYKLNVNDFDLTYTVVAAETLTTVATAIAALIDARPLVTATSSVAVITVLTTLAGSLSKYSGFNHTLLQFKDTTSDPGIVADYEACKTEQSNFFKVCYDAVGEDEWLEMAPICEADRRLQSHCFSDSLVLDSGDTTSVWSATAAGSYAFSSPGFALGNGTHLAAARAGKCLPFSPGSETWSLQTLAAVSADEYTSGQRAALESKKGWYYTTIAGNGNTKSGKLGDTGVGEWTDVVRFLQWQRVDLQASFYTALKAGPKVPFTNTGIAGIESAIRGSIQRGINVGGLSEDTPPTFVFPKASDFTPTEKKARNYSGITWAATLAGAIHTGQATGTVTA